MAHNAYEHNHVGCCSHSPSIWHEFVCHVPYTVVSLALGFALAAILQVIGDAVARDKAASAMMTSGYHTLFHVFHFLHIVFAVTGTTVTFFRYSRQWVVGILISLCVPALLCMLSDSILPAVAGSLLGVSMHLHVCLLQPYDAFNVLVFMLAGLGVGIALLHNATSLRIFSHGSHFFHILCSSLASLFYIVSHGFTQWSDDLGVVFISLFVVVIIPCTLSDVVVPLYFVKRNAESRKE